MQPMLPFAVSSAPNREVAQTSGAPLVPTAPPRRAPQPSHFAPLVFVRHPRARRYVVRVRTDGSVRVTIPRWGSKRAAAAFAEQQQEWIEKQQRRVAEARLNRGPQMPAVDQRAGRAQAKKELPSRLMQLAEAFGLSVSRISIRNQRWRWGSCSRHGHICLNWRLVTMPPRIRDYVLIHELMHLKRLDHSPQFWRLVAGACPDYQEARVWLRKHQHLLDGHEVGFA